MHGIGHRGSLLVVTLWLIVALAAAAVALSSYLSTETRLMRYHIAKAQARAWAESGVVLALERLVMDAKPEQTNPDKSYDWLGDEWAYVPGQMDSVGRWLVKLPTKPESQPNFSGALTIRIVDEERKLGINRIATLDDEQLFGRLFKNPNAAALIADYVDQDSLARSQFGVGMEHSPTYTAKNADIKHLAELRDIPGLPEEPAFWKTLHDEVTAEPVQKLNINTVSLAILKAIGLPLTTEVVGAIDRHRTRTDGIFDDPSTIVSTFKLSSLSSTDQATLKTWFQERFGVTSSSFLITSEVTLEAPPVSCRIDAIVRRKSSAPTASMTVAGESFDIVTWSEQ